MIVAIPQRPKRGRRGLLIQDARGRAGSDTDQGPYVLGAQPPVQGLGDHRSPMRAGLDHRRSAIRDLYMTEKRNAAEFTAEDEVVL